MPIQPTDDIRYRWKTNPQADNCPSCLAASGQIHSGLGWLWHNVVPGSSRLMCQAYCHCELVETNKPEWGDIEAIPLRGDIDVSKLNKTPLTECRALFALTGTPNADGSFQIIAIDAGDANGWTFSADVLRASLPLWEGVETFIDHPGWFEDRSLRHFAGQCHNALFNEELNAIQLTLVPGGPEAQLLRDFAALMLTEEGPHPRVGFSADLICTANARSVNQITRIMALDLVHDPARGGRFLRAMNQNLHLFPVRADLRAGTHFSVGPPDLRAGTHFSVGPVGPLSPSTPLDTTAPTSLLSSQPKETSMTIPLNQPPPAPAPAPPTPADPPRPQLDLAALQHDAEAIRTLLNVQAEQSQMAAEVASMQAIRLQACRFLLDSGLTASALPPAAQDFLRAQFANRVFEPNELTAAIAAQRDYISKLTSTLAVRGPGNVSAMFDTRDQLQAAVDDLLDAPRAPGAETLKAHRLSGIRELYLAFTGDDNFYGGYFPERVQLSTGSFTSFVKNAMNKALVKRWDELGKAGYLWWEKIATIEKFRDLKQITWLVFGSIGSLPVVAKGAEYTPLMIGDQEEVSNFVKYGGYVGIDREDIINDDTRKLRLVPKELANAGIRNISSLVAAIFTDNSAIGPTLADGGALFNNTAVTTAGGHANLLTTALGTVYTAWEAAAAAMYNQPMLVSDDTGYIGTGKKQALDPKFCLVPRALKGQAEALFIPRWEAQVEAIASAGGPTYGGHVVPLTVPEWTDATDWAAVADPLLAPGVMIGEVFGVIPEIFVAGDELSPAVFMNDEFRAKVRQEVAVGVANFRPLHKNNVA